MTYTLLKVVLTSLVIVSISEVAKRSSFLAAVLASLPLTSLLAMVWLYLDTKETERVIELSHGIFWMVLPSLVFFRLFPVLLKWGWNFYLCLVCSVVGMSLTYWVYTHLLTRVGIRL